MDSKKEFKLAMVNEPWVFELSRFYCTYFSFDEERLKKGSEVCCNYFLM